MVCTQAIFSTPKVLDSTCFSCPASPTLFHTSHLCCRLSSREDRTLGVSFLLEILKDRPFSFKRFLQKSLWWTDTIGFLKVKTWKSDKDFRFSLPCILAPCPGTRKPIKSFWTLLLSFRTELPRPSFSLHSSSNQAHHLPASKVLLPHHEEAQHTPRGNTSQYKQRSSKGWVDSNVLSTEGLCKNPRGKFHLIKLPVPFLGLILYPNIKFLPQPNRTFSPEVL